MRQNVDVPVIASGGAGEVSHVVDLYQTDSADAALLAGILHDQTTSIKSIKDELIRVGLPVRTRQ